MRNLELRASEIKEVDELVGHAQKIVQDLKGRKTNAPKDAYFYLSSVLPEMIAFIEVEMPNPKASSKIRKLPAEMAPAADGTSSRRTRCLGSAAGTEIRQNYRRAFRIATARKRARSGEPRKDSSESGGNQRRTEEKAGEGKEAEGQGGWCAGGKAGKIERRNSGNDSSSGSREIGTRQREGGERRSERIRGKGKRKIGKGWRCRQTRASRRKAERASRKVRAALASRKRFRTHSKLSRTERASSCREFQPGDS